MGEVKRWFFGAAIGARLRKAVAESTVELDGEAKNYGCAARKSRFATGHRIIPQPAALSQRTMPLIEDYVVTVPFRFKIN